MYQVEKGIELVNVERGRKGIYPFRQMEIGDSFVCEFERRHKVATAATGLKPMKFATRIVVENGKRVCRVWRIA